MQSWLRWLRVGLAVAAVLILPLPALAATYTVTITDSLFVPSYLKVGIGDTITFVNSTSATQSAKTTLASGFNTGNIGPGSTKSVTVSTAGTYSYASAFNSVLTGTVVVGTASASTTSDATGGASSSATTKTTVPASSQPQPVSGTFEVVLMLGAAGFAFLAFGLYSKYTKLFVPSRSLVDLPTIRAERQSHEQSES